ncbi:MauE/DoxX family redox-associated membrane protein [Serinicoccus kebangsaanensis]|uniref:MauE/DoxX family redox-associated membrane protein n=1 Tax=Serinicoccus kebangsaanensis TaxID=2602069 RepID=UPI00124E25E7|nr:MauE/DoxX family redox-associated membrane protein [Serinicoccus kebangsaanensis]
MTSVLRPPVARDRSTRVLDVLGLVLRLGLAGVLGYAGWTKITDLTGSVQNVLAYELFGYELARAIGILLPVVELALALLLLVGLLTRAGAAAAALLMVVFIAGIASAWARGLAIDCGCFGTGGPVAPEDTRYLSEMLRDVGFLAMAAWLTVRPRTLASVDSLLQKGA